MQLITFPRSRRFMVAVAATLAALLMVTVSTAVKNAHSQTTTTNANRAFSGFHDKPIHMPFNTMGKVATLKIPVAGSYVINAKLVAHYPFFNPGHEGRCALTAGAEFDEVIFDISSHPDDNNETLALQLTHTFASPGSVTLSCSGDGATAEDIKITAVQVGNLTNTPI